MWLSNECSSKSPPEPILYRSNSPPLEGGESLCEIYSQQSEKKDRSKPLYVSTSADPSFKNPSEGIQSDSRIIPTKVKFPNKFISFLNQDLLPSNSFTQTFLQSILSSVDSSDPVVANAWMETLLDVVDLLPKEIIKGEILALAVSKGQLSQPVSSRLLCCKMIGKICMKFDPYIIVKEVLPVVLSLCQDVDFEVRGHMCRQLAVIAKGIGLEPTKSAILPELVELSNDEETFVRLAGIETVVQLLPILDDDTCQQTIIPLVKKICEISFSAYDSTLPVVTKQLGQLCHGLAANFTAEQKQWFLRYFQDVSKLGLKVPEKRPSIQLSSLPDLLPVVDNKDRFQECRQACAFNFPAMVLFAGRENFEQELYTSFKELCSDPFPNVRRTMASGFYEVARLLGDLANLLHCELVLLLKDESTEVLKRLIPFLPDSLKLVSCCKSSASLKHTSSRGLSEDAEKELVQALLCCEEAVSVTSSWRLHADFLSSLSCLPLCISSETVFDTFVPLLFIKLHTARPLPCRIAASYSLLIFLRSTAGLDRRKGIINEMIRELCHGKSCHKRMLFIRICELAVELFSKVFFKLHFFKPLLGLSVDPVPNVRLRLCAVLPQLKSLLLLPKDGHLLQELESCIKTVMTHEKDRDVVAAVSKAIQELDRIEVATEAMSQRSSIIELDLKDWQKENEEREWLELDSNRKLEENCKTSKDSAALETLVYRSGKIPIRKSGTLPKALSKSKKERGTFDGLFLECSKAIKCSKEEAKTSDQGSSINSQKSIPKNTKFSIPVSHSEASLVTTKFSISKTRRQNVTTNTWPRQKRSSNIPKQTNSECSSPKPQRHSTSPIVPAQSTTVEANQEESITDKRVSLQKDDTSSIKRRTKRIPVSESLRKSATFTNLSIESKIPTSNLR